MLYTETEKKKLSSQNVMRRHKTCLFCMRHTCAPPFNLYVELRSTKNVLFCVNIRGILSGLGVEGEVGKKGQKIPTIHHRRDESNGASIHHNVSKFYKNVSNHDLRTFDSHRGKRDGSILIQFNTLDDDNNKQRRGDIRIKVYWLWHIPSWHATNKKRKKKDTKRG